MSPAVHLAAFVLFVFVAALSGPKVRRWWRKGCDRCRLEDMSGGVPWTNVPHTCFPWRSLYRDRKGRLFVFGKLIQSEVDQLDRTTLTPSRSGLTGDAGEPAAQRPAKGNA